MFARDATPQVNISRWKIFASSTRMMPWMARIIKPARIHAGASVSSRKLAREASNATTEYSSRLDSSVLPAMRPTGVTAPIRPDSVMSRTVQVALSRKGIAPFRAAPMS